MATAIPRPGFGTRFGKGRIGRGLFRKGAQFGGTTFRFVPEWKKNTMNEIRPSGLQYSHKVHQGMCDAMRGVSRRSPGGGVEKNEDGWTVGIGSPPYTHTHWHLLEFGGGYHYAHGSVRQALNGMGRFEPAGRPS